MIIYKKNLWLLGGLIALFAVIAIFSHPAPCGISKVTKTVRGNSLAGLINDGDKVKLLEHYYECNEVMRNDIVAYPFAGSNQIIIKKVRAVPGDHWGVVPTDRQNEYKITVNAIPLSTADGRHYLINTAQKNLLSLYINDYDGVVPKDAYLILGELPGGTLDSTQFGLVSKKDFIGKILLP